MSNQNQSLLARLFPFLSWWPVVNRQTLSADMSAGLTGTIIVLPQGIAFATIAGLPPEYGLYSAIIPAIVAGLFGSCHHLISGPTTAISIVVFSKVSTLATPFTEGYITMVLTLTFLAGCIQFSLGLARLGAVANFVSHSVVIGFTTGAAILILTGQLHHFVGFSIHKGESFLHTWADFLRHLSETNLRVLMVSSSTLLTALLVRRLRPRWPGLLIALIVGGLIAALIDGKAHGLAYVSSLPGRLPPLSIPDLSTHSLRELVPGALAVAMLGLAEAVAIARSVAARSHQHVDNNQEFIGQGLSNVIGSFFSSYASSGSFTRTGVNFDAGAITPMAAVYSALFLTGAIMIIAPLTVYLPVAAMAGILMLVACNLIDPHRIKTILRTSTSESAVLITTFLSTLFVQLEFAVYSGVLLSLLLYLKQTSHPHFVTLAPFLDGGDYTFVDARGDSASECEQLKIIRIDGSIFFGAVNHITEELHRIVARNPDQRHFLVVGSGINFIDVSGCEMLFHEGHSLHREGVQLYLTSIKSEVMGMLKRGGCLEIIGESNVFSSKIEAVRKIIPLLDPERCNKCLSRVFRECPRRP